MTDAETGRPAAKSDDSPGLTADLWLLQDARAELEAARAVLAEPGASPRCAAVHVVRAWEYLAFLRARAAGTAPPERDALGAWVRTLKLDEGARSRAASAIEELCAIECAPPWQDAPEPARLSLQQSTAPLAEALSAADAELLHSTERRKRWRRWSIRLAVASGALAAAIVYANFWRAEPVGPWHAEYSARHGGHPIARRDHDVDFDWKLGPPLIEIGIDRFSVRWQTCLALESATRVTFELTSDDGSRLYVDGELAIDNWKTPPPVSSTTQVELEGGLHSLRVDYFDDRGPARVRLRAAFDDDPMGPIPTAMLLYPGTDFDRANPCTERAAEEPEEEE